MDIYFDTIDGLFVYRPENHALEQLYTQNIREKLLEATSGASSVATAGCNIIIAGSSRKLASKFRDKSRTYMFLEAGHIAQNIQLQAVAMGLGSVTIGGHNTRETTRACRLPKGYEAIYVIPVGRPAVPTTQPLQTQPLQPQPQQTAAPVPNQPVRPRAVFIIPSQAFHDDELFQPQRALDLAGVQTVIASKKTGPVQGMLGNAAPVTLALNQLRVDDFQAVIFVGGTGVQEYYDDPLAHSIAREAMQKQKLVGATSMAPTILAKAGVLTGYRVTGFVSQKETLQQAGAIYIGIPVERDKNLITSSGPMAAPDFARALTAALTRR
jgi:protease I